MFRHLIFTPDDVQHDREAVKKVIQETRHPLTSICSNWKCYAAYLLSGARKQTAYQYCFVISAASTSNKNLFRTFEIRWIIYKLDVGLRYRKSYTPNSVSGCRSRWCHRIQCNCVKLWQLRNQISLDHIKHEWSNEHPRLCFMHNSQFGLRLA